MVTQPTGAVAAELSHMPDCLSAATSQVSVSAAISVIVDLTCGHRRNQPGMCICTVSAAVPLVVNLANGSCFTEVSVVTNQVSASTAVVLLNVFGCRLTYLGQAETNAWAWFSIALRPRKL